MNEVFTEKQAAEFLQVPEATLRTLRIKGKPGSCPPYTKMLGKVRYQKSTIEQWLSEQEGKNEQEASA